MSKAFTFLNSLKVLGFIIFAQLAGFIGGFFTSKSVGTWFVTLKKPVFNPPGWVFGPVWFVLYTLMGVSAYLVYNRGWEKMDVKIALGVFTFQLILNALWSILFFGMQNPFYAFIEIIFLWLAILATIILFYRLDVWAGHLMIPYILWVSFAAVLNYSIFVLNR